MKKIVIVLLVIVVVIGAGYYVYHSIVPNMVAEAVVADELPAYIPKRLQPRVEAIRAPINEGADAMLKKMDESDVPVKEILETVDRVSEDEAYAMLDEINKSKPSTPDEVFTIAKQYLDADFDLEILREPFVKHFKMKQINQAIEYANHNRKTKDIDIATAKAIARKIIIEKSESGS